VRPGSASPEDRFQELYKETRQDLLRYVRRRAATPEDAADALAETYLIAWRTLDTLPEGDRARLWLFGVARNLLLKTARQAKVRTALSDRLAAELRATVPNPATMIPDKQSDELRKALTQLSDQDREILTLTAWDGLSPREIATVMNSHANTIRVRLHRARTRLRRQLDHGQWSPGNFPPPQPAADSESSARP
jgi:RNA polymerase sigma factor (sigma-70 family)